ncbi:MAG: hypothetical protein QOI35_1789, partial [Cryptosporangiaceae bacterium]|nr:hypothetical protein [Cryptosporangiaceae bacterium]
WRRSYQDLMRELACAGPLPGVAGAPPAPRPPRQPPPDVAGFTGRTAVLAALGDLLAGVGEGRP